MRTYIETMGLDPTIFTLGVAALWAWVLVVLRNMPKLAWHRFCRWFLMDVTVRNSDPPFGWVEAWLAAQPYARQAKSIRLTSAMVAYDDEEPVQVVPSTGTHYFRWRGRWVRVEHSIDQAATGSTKLRETICITMRARHRALLAELIAEAKAATSSEDAPTVGVWAAEERWWCHATKLVPRRPETLVLKAGLLEDIIDDARRFDGSKAWYMARGIPYRRGYLFEGPPGTGKTSAVHTIASELGRPVYVVSLASTNDDSLRKLVSAVPRRAVLLMEDVDCAGVGRCSDSEKKGVTLSGLLNSIDGLLAGEGRLLIMTTNAAESLDPALVRPGRADRTFHFGLADADMVCRMVRCFHPNIEPSECVRLSQQWKGRSPAEIQASLLTHG